MQGLQAFTQVIKIILKHVLFCISQIVSYYLFGIRQQVLRNAPALIACDCLLLVSRKFISLFLHQRYLAPDGRVGWEWLSRSCNVAMLRFQNT